MAGVDAILGSQHRAGTQLFRSVEDVNCLFPYDRIIVITDEQATGCYGGAMPDPRGTGYLINVASARNGVGYGAWKHIDGFSENVFRYIREVEEAGL